MLIAKSFFQETNQPMRVGLRIWYGGWEYRVKDTSAINALAERLPVTYISVPNGTPEHAIAKRHLKTVETGNRESTFAGQRGQLRKFHRAKLAHYRQINHSKRGDAAWLKLRVEEVSIVAKCAIDDAVREKEEADKWAKTAKAWAAQLDTIRDALTKAQGETVTDAILGTAALIAERDELRSGITELRALLNEFEVPAKADGDPRLTARMRFVLQQWQHNIGKPIKVAPQSIAG